MILIKGIKVTDFTDSYLTVKGIFLHGHNWDIYRMFHGHELRTVEVEEVTKMLDCRTEKRGFTEYCCPICNEPRTIYFGCNSRICSICGKYHSDRWADSMSRNMFDVVHRHVVLSLPERMWGLFLEDRGLLKVLMDSAIETRRCDSSSSSI